MKIKLQWNPVIINEFRTDFDDEDEISITQGGLRISDAKILLTDIAPSDQVANLRFGFIQNAMPSYIQWYYQGNTRRTVKAMLSQRLDGPPNSLFFSGCKKIVNPNVTQASITLPAFEDYPCTTGLTSFSSLSGSRHLRLWAVIVNAVTRSTELVGQCDWCITYDVVPQDNEDEPARVGPGARVEYMLKTRAELLHSTPWVVYSGPRANDEIAQNITNQKLEGNNWVIDDEPEPEQDSDDEIEIIHDDMSGFIPPFTPNM